jgi:hypothetical protein
MESDLLPVDPLTTHSLGESNYSGTHLTLLMKLIKPASPRLTSDLPVQWTPGENNYSEKHLALLAMLMDQEN